MVNFSGAYKRLAVAIFGGVVDRYADTFKPLKPYLMGARISILLKTWACLIMLSTLLAYIISLISVWIVSVVLYLDFISSLYYILFIPVLAAAMTFLFFYIYPIQKSNSIKGTIETDLPFALAHMSAIASSGVPPEFMFQLLTDFKEYRNIAKDAKIVVRNIKTFGMSSTAAIGNVARRTPSANFKQILDGIVSTIEKGGDLISYLDEMSEKALFDYRIKRENYLKMLSTYADIYTALLVAAPLMMLSVLGMINIIGGEVLGLTANELIWLITWIALPLMNAGFLLFIHLTYPSV